MRREFVTLKRTAKRGAGGDSHRLPIQKSGGARSRGECCVEVWNWRAPGPLGVSYADRGAVATGRGLLSHGKRRRNERKEGVSMVKIAPSILSADFANLERDIQRIAAADYVHVDVMDGVFVPNISIGLPVVQSIRKVTEMPLDVHLMIVEPLRYVEQFCDAGADLVTIHVEADTPERIHQAIAAIRAKGKRPGVVLKPGTPAQAVLPYLKDVDMVLVMTVEPGFGGQSFMADMMPKVSAIRQYIDEQNPQCELEVDGGVAPDTCKTCIDAGANVLVAGSAVYKAADIPARIAQLRG